MSAEPYPLHAVETSRPTVSVVLPCLDEEQAVGDCVRTARLALSDAGYDGEVIVVDNGSTDASAGLARDAGARVVGERTKGYGAALRSGFRAAHGEIIVMADCDGTYPLEHLAELVDCVAFGEVDLMIGARLDAATPSTMPFLHRYVGTPALTHLVRMAGGQSHLTDSQSGFRAFRRVDLERLRLTSTGMELASEMLVRAGHERLRIAELPLGYHPRQGESKLSTWRDGFRHLRCILGLGPHLALWYPGIITCLVSIVLLVASLFYPEGLAVGDVFWQPVFAASILAVVGVCAAVAGALLAALGPDTHPDVRARFAWVRRRRTGRVVRAGALLVGGVGLAIDLMLFVRWSLGAPVPRVQLQLAALAQASLVSAAVLLMVTALHRLLLHRAVVA